MTADYRRLQVGRISGARRPRLREDFHRLSALWAGYRRLRLRAGFHRAVLVLLAGCRLRACPGRSRQAATLLLRRGLSEEREEQDCYFLRRGIPFSGVHFLLRRFPEGRRGVLCHHGLRAASRRGGGRRRFRGLRARGTWYNTVRCPPRTFRLWGEPKAFLRSRRGL